MHHQRYDSISFHDDGREQLCGHFADFLDAYDIAHSLKTLAGLKFHEYIRKIRTSEPERLALKQTHQIPKLNI